MGVCSEWGDVENGGVWCREWGCREWNVRRG